MQHYTPRFQIECGGATQNVYYFLSVCKGTGLATVGQCLISQTPFRQLYSRSTTYTSPYLVEDMAKYVGCLLVSQRLPPTTDPSPRG